MILQDFVTKSNQKADQLDKNIILSIVRKNPSKTLLDTGCDHGDFTKLVAKATCAKEVYGVEIEPTTAILAKKKGIKVLKVDLNKPLDLPSDKFDLITSIQNIEHLYFTDLYLDEMKRLLKKDGILIITTTNLAAWHYRIQLLFGMLPMCLHPSVHQSFPLSGKNCEYGHHSVFTHSALKNTLKKHDFIIKKDYTHSIYFLPSFLSKLLCSIFNWGTFSCFVVQKK